MHPQHKTTKQNKPEFEAVLLALGLSTEIATAAAATVDVFELVAVDVGVGDPFVAREPVAVRFASAWAYIVYTCIDTVRLGKENKKATTQPDKRSKDWIVVCVGLLKIVFGLE